MTLLAEINKLSVEDRLALLGQIWDGIAAHPADVPVSPQDLALVRQRMDDIDSGQVRPVAWEEMQAELKS